MFVILQGDVIGMCFHVFPPALCVRGLSEKAIRECEHMGGGGGGVGGAAASHSESTPQSVCAPLTQCRLWTPSAVLFLSSSPPPQKKPHNIFSSTGGERISKSVRGLSDVRERVSAAECESEAAADSTTHMQIRAGMN